MNGGFVHANFTSADLTQISAFNADFLAADFRNARMANADLRSVRMNGAGLVCTNVDNAIIGPAEPL